MYKSMDFYNSPKLMKDSVAVWFNVRVSLANSLIVLAVVVLALYTPSSASAVGLALVTTIGMAQIVIRLLESLGSGEAQFNSIERLLFYCEKLPSESAASFPSDPASEKWPTQGSVELKNVDIAYPSRPDHLVIKDLSLSISAGEHIGVVGRTGKTLG
jgi:ATP-binding cassette subfamily C (CFTR/MRP) protein 1